jgi:23S rRNA (uracil-5-)-methyltransferase RumA
LPAEAQAPPPTLGAEASIEIEDLEPDGSGVGLWPMDDADADTGAATDEAWTVRVDGALPGERARVRIEHVSRARTQAYGVLIELERPSPARRSPPCPHHPAREGECGGCPLMGLEIEKQRELKREQLRRRHGIELDELIGGQALGYRMSSKRVVGGRAGAPCLGSFRRRSHAVVSMRGCRVDHPRIVACFAELEDALTELRIEPFDERAGEGDLRYVWAKTDGEKVLLTLVTAAKASRAATELPARLQLPAGIAWSVQAARTNAIRGDAPRTLRGDAGLSMRLAGIDVEIGPLGFLQPNPHVAARAYEDLLVDADGQRVVGELALDLYAGTGVVTRRLRTQFQRVRACELHPDQTRVPDVDVDAVDAAEFLVRSDVRSTRPTLVVANPPRSGMGDEVCGALVRLEPELVTIMSCNPRSLVRDLAALDDTHALVRVRGYDTLPQTTHLELVAWLQRRPRSGS